MQQVLVDLGTRSYPIFIGQNLIAKHQVWPGFLHNKHILIVSNTTVAPLYLDSVTAKLAQMGHVNSVVLPDGEQFKTLEHLEHIFETALTLNYARDCVFIALGGGVIGDMTGFAASCYQRGVDFIQIPTTLLAQVDSSVGGKTAVNHALGKNMIGAFYQPKSVMIDTDYLKTLPPQEFSAGMAEVIKYGIIWDKAFFHWLEKNIDKLKSLNTQALVYAIKRCCEIKAEVVKQDEQEHGVRALLNLGHTFGHAIEAEMGYGNWLHGEAVATGTVLACKTALAANLLDITVVEQVIAILKAFDLPIDAPATMNFESFIKHMRRDKKVLSGQIRLVLPQDIGKAAVFSDISESILKHVLDHRS